MLTCVFHPIDTMQVVEEDDAIRMKASGVWFDTPKEAIAYREMVEGALKEESKPKGKLKGTRK